MTGGERGGLRGKKKNNGKNGGAGSRVNSRNLRFQLRHSHIFIYVAPAHAGAQWRGSAFERG